MSLGQIIILIKKHQVLFLLTVSFFLFFFRIWTGHIFFTDELIIEDASYAMGQGGSLIVPTLDGLPYLTKPPLLYWQIAPLYYFFPPIHFWVRLWMPIYGIGLVFVTYKLGSYWYGKSVGFLSAFFLATSIPIIYFTKAANYDLPNAFFTTLSIYLYNLSKNKPKLLNLTALVIGLGILERSLLALTPLAIIFFDQLLSKNKLPMIRLITGLAITLIIVIGWNTAAYFNAPEIFIRDNFILPFQLHLTGVVPGDIETDGFFYTSIFSWFPLTIFLFCYSFFGAFKSKNDALRQLLVWGLGLGGMLMLAKTQHNWYFLALYPALAISAGCIVNRILQKTASNSRIRLLTLFALIVFTTVGPLSLLLSDIPQADPMIGVEYIKHNSDEPVYFWRYPLIPQTKFFPGRPVVILNPDNIGEMFNNKQLKFLLSRTVDVPEIYQFSNPTTIYSGPQVTLLQFY